MPTHRLSEKTVERLTQYAHKRYEEGKLTHILKYTVDDLVSELLTEVGF